MRVFTLPSAEVEKKLEVTRAALCIWRKERRGPAWREVPQPGNKRLRFFYDPLSVKAHQLHGRCLVERVVHLEDVVTGLVAKLETMEGEVA